MTLKRIKNYPYPSRVKTVDDVDKHLKRIYEAQQGESVDRILDFDHLMPRLITIDTTIPQADDITAIDVDLDIDPGADPSAEVYQGIDVDISTNASNSEDFGIIYGVSSTVDHNGTGTISSVDGVLGSAVTDKDSGVFTQLKGVWGHTVPYSSGTSAFGVQGNVDQWGGDIVNVRGIRGRTQIATNDTVKKTITDTSVDGLYMTTSITGTASYAAATTRLAGAYFEQTFGANATTTNGYGILIKTPTATHNPTNYYGIYLEDQGGVGDTLNYSIYSGGGICHFGDGTNYTEIADNGEVTFTGTARTVRDMWIPATGVKAPGTKPATWKEWGISGVWEFSDATDDTIVANVKFPNDMDLTVAPSVVIGWSTNTAVVTETARWQLEYLYTAPGEDTTANAQATIYVDSDAVAQADGLIVVALPAMAVPGSTDACVHMRIKRLGATDDLTDTAEFHGLCMSYTSNKLGT